MLALAELQVYSELNNKIIVGQTEMLCSLKKCFRLLYIQQAYSHTICLKKCIYDRINCSYLSYISLISIQMIDFQLFILLYNQGLFEGTRKQTCIMCFQIKVKLIFCRYERSRVEELVLHSPQRHLVPCRLYVRATLPGRCIPFVFETGEQSTAVQRRSIHRRKCCLCLCMT